jgi:hypothetical protein
MTPLFVVGFFISRRPDSLRSGESQPFFLVMWKSFYIFVKKIVMVNKVFMVLGLILLIGGNILSYVYNGRMLYTMTNVCFVLMIVLNFYNYRSGKRRDG